MAGRAAASGSSPGVAGPADALVRHALAAAALLVAQQVAAKATRDALLLSTYPVTVLPVASGAAAAVSMAGVWAFSRGMARASPRAVLERVLAANLVALAVQWGLALVAPRVAAVTLYLHVGLFGATVLSGFWSVVNERFDPHTARRVVGRIGTGATLGGVAGGLLTWQAARRVGVPTMLLLLAALLAAALAATRRLEAGTAPAPERVRPPLPTPAAALALIARQPHLRDLACLVALGALTEALFEYAMSAAVVRRYGRGEALLSFFALYHTGVGLLALAVQSLVARRSLETLGLAGTLASAPALGAVGGIAAALVPRLWPAIAVRAAHAVLARSLFRSAYELLYTPMAPERKRPVKVLLDVAADRAGTIAGSTLIVAVLMLPGAGHPRRLLALGSAVSVATLLLTRRVHRGYVGSLADSVRAGALHLGPELVAEAMTHVALAPEPLAGDAADAGEAGDATDAAGLRSGDADRIREVLSGPAPLPPRLVALTVPLLARDDVFAEAVRALRRSGARCTGQLVDVLLDPDQDPVVRRRVPRVLKAVATQRSVDGLLEAIRDERFDVRYRSAQALLRLLREPSLSIPPTAAFAAARAELSGTKPSARGLEHVITLLSLGLPGEPLAVALRAWRSGEPVLRGTALEYFENVLPSVLRAELWPWLGARPAPSGRTADRIRDDLLRSTASWRSRRRSRPGSS